MYWYDSNLEVYLRHSLNLVNVSHFCFRSPKVKVEQWEYTKGDEKVVYKKVEVYQHFRLSQLQV